MITRAFLTLVIGELPDSTDRRLSHRDRGIGQVPLHHRPDPPRHLVRASMGLPAGESHVSRKNLTRRSPRPSRPGASSLGMNSAGSAGNSTAARNTPSLEPK